MTKTYSLQLKDNWALYFMKLDLFNNLLHYLQKTIGELASISEKEVVTRFFKTTMQKLLKVTQEASKAENSRTSNSMQVDHSSEENSLSLTRWDFWT